MGLGCSNTYMIYISASQMWMPMSFLGILQKGIYFIQYIWYFAFLLFLEFFFYWSIVALQCCVNFSVHFSLSVMYDSLQPHGLQDARLACLSPTPRAYSNSCPSRRWCHPTIWSSVVPFSSHLQSFPASGSFPMSRVFCNDSGLCMRWPKYWSFSFSISPFNEYSGLISFRRDWLDLLAVQGILKSLLQHHSSKASIL